MTSIWKPSHPQETNMWRFMIQVTATHGVLIPDYAALHRWSIEHPTLFWQTLCDYFKITFDTNPQHILNTEHNLLDARWFTGATFNFAEQLLSRSNGHLNIVSIDERGTRDTLDYNQITELVGQFAAGLRDAGVEVGDRVAAVMPNVAFTIIAMLATASIGAVWSSCSPDFGANAIIDRLSQIEPKVVLMCDGHTYHGKTFDGRAKIEAVSKLSSVTHLVIYPHIQTDFQFDSIAKACPLAQFLKPTPPLRFTPYPFNHPLYILFSSGTTGKPKCIVHGAGGTLLQHIKELGLHTDISARDNLYFYTTCGWMMWNWMVSALALGATITLYEGSPTYPDFGCQFQLIHEEQVTVFGTSAKFLASVEKEGFWPAKNFPMPSLRTILSTGSPLLPSQYDFVYQHIKSDVQLCSISGGTDIISCFALGNPILPVYPGELQCLGLGMAVEIYDEQGCKTVDAIGELVATKPFPSMPIAFWHDPDRTLYKEAYFSRFPGVWVHGDFAKITPHGGLIIYGRSDATLNPGGVRIGTAEIYRQIETLPEILDSVVIGQPFDGDVRVVLFVKLREGYKLDDTLQTKIRQVIRSNASPRHVPNKILQVDDIPRTINGKVVEIAVRQIVLGLPIKNIDSLANPESLNYFKDRSELAE